MNDDIMLEAKEFLKFIKDADISIPGNLTKCREHLVIVPNLLEAYTAMQALVDWNVKFSATVENGVTHILVNQDDYGKAKDILCIN